MLQKKKGRPPKPKQEPKGRIIFSVESSQPQSPVFTITRIPRANRPILQPCIRGQMARCSGRRGGGDAGRHSTRPDPDTQRVQQPEPAT